MRRVWMNTSHVQRHWNQRSLFTTNRFVQNPTLPKQKSVSYSPSLAKEFFNQYRIRTCHFAQSKFQSSTIRNFSNSDSSQKEATAKRLFVNDAKVSISPDLIGLGIVTFGAFLIMLPRDAYQKLKKSPEVYDEIEVEDDVYNRMNVISKEVRGEITKRILGKDISELDDDGMATNTTADVVADVLNSDALQNAIASLITRVISSAQFQSACQSLLKNLWKDLINDPETTAQVVVLLNTSINDERIKKSFRELVLGLLQDDEIYKELSNIVVRLGEDQEVLNAAKELLTESAHKALNDPEILDHSMEFATDVVGDNILQKTSGEALRNTVTYAVRPSLSAFLSALGVLLILFSASAFGEARMAARMSRDVDASASLVMKSVSDTVWKMIAKFISFPGKAFASACEAASKVVLAPFEIVTSITLAAAKYGMVVLSSVQQFISTVLNSPRVAMDAAVALLVSIQSALSSLTTKSLSFILSLPNKSASLIASMPGVIFREFKTFAIALSLEISTLCKMFGKSALLFMSKQTCDLMNAIDARSKSITSPLLTTFDIMAKNVVANSKWSIIQARDFSQYLVSSLVHLFTRRRNDNR